MNLPPEQYFVLIVPACLILFGLALGACWWILREQRFLPWLAAGYILPALALGAQSLMSNAQLAESSVFAGACYLGGMWALSRGLAMRYGGDADPKLAAGIAVVTLAVLYHYSVVEDVLRLRIVWLNTSLALMLLLPIRAIFAKPAHDRLERVLRLSYLLSLVYALARPVLVLSLASNESVDALTRSGYWVLMLLGALLFSIWLMLMLLASAMRDVVLVLREERNRDPLTQLLNRRAFFELAEQRLQDRRQGPWALLVCDIDHFKRVNDVWGHAAGDRVLESVAQVLLTQVRQADLVSRFGGEEFIVLLNRADLDCAQTVAQRIRTHVAGVRFDAVPVTVTASFGLTAVDSPRDLRHAIERADVLLYQAKQSGRDRVCVSLVQGAEPQVQAG